MCLEKAAVDDARNMPALYCDGLEPESKIHQFLRSLREWRKAHKKVDEIVLIETVIKKKLLRDPIKSYVICNVRNIADWGDLVHYIKLGDIRSKHSCLDQPTNYEEVE